MDIFGACLPFAQVFSLLLTKKTAMFTVLYRHSHSNWQSNAAFLYVLAESNIMLTWKYIIVLDIKGKQYFKLYYMYIVEIPTNKRANSYKLKILKIGN